MATTTTTPGRTTPPPHRPRRLATLAWIIGPTLVVLLAGAAVYGLFLRDTSPTETSVPAGQDAPAGADDGGAPAEPAAPPADDDPAPLTPEDQAALDVEARYREYSSTELAFVSDPPDRFYESGLSIDTVAAGLLRDGTVIAYNDVALADSEIKRVEGTVALIGLTVTDAELFEEPQTVDEREGVLGLATVDVCRDVSDTRSLDADGVPVPRQDGDFVLDRTFFSLQPNPANVDDPVTPRWYAVDGRTLWYEGDADIPSQDLIDACPGTVLPPEADTA